MYAADKKFVSFKKVASEMGVLSGGATTLQLASFHSVSKGFVGECVTVHVHVCVSRAVPL